MRITTQMLNESARRAGINLGNMSLLNYVNGSSSGSQSTWMEALNKSKSKAESAVSKSNYEKLEKSAEELLQAADPFAKSKETSIFEKIKENGDGQELYTEIESLVEKYNDTVRNLKTASGPLNDYYAQMMKAAASENEEALNSIGISISKNGMLNLDENKLKAADYESMEEVLGSSASFITKTAFLATRIADNAAENVKSTSSQYNTRGNIYSSNYSKYDFWG